MFPTATFARKVVHREILALFQILLGLATFSNGLSRYAGRAVTGRRWSTPGCSKARSGPFSSRSFMNASTLPPGPSRSDGDPRVSHVLTKD